MSLLGGILGGLFGGGGDDPGDAASPYLQKIQPEVEKYFKPYVDAGQYAVPAYEDQIKRMLADPAGMIKQFGAGYTASPEYQFQRKEATDAANRASAAGGMAGSPAEQQQLAQTVSGLQSQDYQRYLSPILQMYHQGVGGLSGLSGMGERAASGAAEDIASALESQANLAYSAAANRQQQSGGFLGDVLGMFGGGGGGGGIGGLLGGVGSILGSIL